MTERIVQNRAFKDAATSLDLDGNESILRVETNYAQPTLPMSSYASQALTIEEYMIARATSAAGAGFEGFAYFDMDDISFPNNAWIMDISALSLSGAPTGAMVTMGTGPGVAGTRLLMRWDATVTPGIGGILFLQDGLPTVTFPYPISRLAATAQGTPSVLTGDAANPVQMELDPAAAGNMVQFTTRIRSAPQGIKVWGTS